MLNHTASRSAPRLVMAIAATMLAGSLSAGTLAGTVTTSAAAPLGGIEVVAFAPSGSNWSAAGWTNSEADGNYTIDGLADGVYRVLFRDWSQLHAFEYHPDAPSIDDGLDVVIAGGLQTIDATLDEAGRITGRLTDAAGDPLEYPLVFAHTASEPPELLFIARMDEPTGIYDVGGLPTGQYLIQFTGRRGTISYSGYWDGVSLIEQATPVPVTVGQTTAGIDGLLGPPAGGYSGGVDGAVTGPDGAPLGDIEVSLYELRGSQGWVLDQWQTTDAAGGYAFGELEPGTYTLLFRDWNQVFAFTFWGSVSRLEQAAPLTVTDVVEAADITLELGGRISGLLTDPGGRPLEVPMVFVHTFDDQPEVLFLTTPGAATGDYQIGGLPTGDYIVQFTGRQGLDSYSSYYDGREAIDHADPVAVLLGATTNGIDGELGIPPGGVIAGRITDPYNRPFDFARVLAYQDDGADWVLAGEAETLYYEAEYELPLAPGTYRLRFEAGSFLQPDLPAWEYYDDVLVIEQAVDVSVQLGARLDGFDVAVGDLSTGSLSGTVTDAATGTPLGGIEVYVSDRRGRPLYDQIAVTSASGECEVSGLWPEGYFVELYDPGYTYATLRLAEPVLVAEGPVTGVDAALTLAPPGSQPGSITGTVVDETGAPLFGISVRASSLSGDGYGSANSDSNGRFRVRDLPADTYVVRFSSDDGFRVTEWYDDAANRDAATEVTVVDASTTDGVDAALAPAGAITGTITDRFGNDFFIATATAFGFDGGSWQQVGSTSVVYESDYRLGGLPVGTYRVQLTGRGYSGPGQSEFFDDQPTLDLADDVEVRAGEVTTGISGALGQGPPGGVAGVVTDGAGTALEGIEVKVYDDRFELEGTALTGPDGRYRVGDLYRGVHYVEFADPQGAYPAEAWNDVATLLLATPIAVEDTTAAGIDAALDGSSTSPGGGGFRGTVTDNVTGLPVAGVRVKCVDEYFGFVDSCSTETAADGTFQLAGFLPAGTYFVGFTAPSGNWADEWYDDVLRVQQATPLGVVEGQWTDGIDAALEPAGGISGSVTNVGGGAFSRLTVTAFREVDGAWQQYKTTLAFYDTEYELRGLPADTYRVRFRGGSIFNSDFFIEEFYDDVATLAEGTDVTVAVGVTTTGIDAMLDGRGPGSIAGLVTDGAGDGLGGIEVRVYDDQLELDEQAVTAGDGTYLVEGLYRGRYYVVFADPQGVFPGEAFSDVPSLDLATPIFVGDDPVSGIDAVLDGSSSGPGGGGMRGVVTDDTTGAGIAGIRVGCIDEVNGFVAGCSTTTAADGSYQLGGFLPTGSYQVSFRSADGFWAEEWFDDAPRPQLATPVLLVEGAWADGIDAGLEPAGGIAGTVTNEGGGAFARLTVTALRWNGSSWTDFRSFTNIYDTAYRLDGLPAGTYRVRFRGGAISNPSFGIEEYYDDVASVDEGTDAPVFVGTITSGIDAVLGDLDGGERGLGNGSFHESLEPWQTITPAGSSIHHGSLDVASSAASGSAEANHDGPAGPRLVLEQCVAVAPGVTYRAGAWLRVDSTSGTAPAGFVELSYFADAECSSAPLAAAAGAAAAGAHDWLPVEVTATSPGGSVAARVSLVLDAGDLTSFHANWDEAWLEPETGALFADGFESGDVTAW